MFSIYLQIEKQGVHIPVGGSDSTSCGHWCGVAGVPFSSVSFHRSSKTQVANLIVSGAGSGRWRSYPEAEDSLVIKYLYDYWLKRVPFSGAS